VEKEIKAVIKSNAAKRGRAVELQKSCAGLKSELERQQSMLALANNFIDGSLVNFSDKGAVELDVLHELDNDDEVAKQKAEQMQRLGAIQEAPRGLDNAEEKALLLEAGYDLYSKRAGTVDVDPAAPDTKVLQAGSLLEGLQSGLSEFQRDQQQEEGALRRHYEELLKNEFIQKAALLKNQAKLMTERASLTKVGVLLSDAIAWLEDNHAKLEQSLKSVTAYTKKMSTSLGGH
jgi:hypothetical protein